MKKTVEEEECEKLLNKYDVGTMFIYYIRLFGNQKYKSCNIVSISIFPSQMRRSCC